MFLKKHLHLIVIFLLGILVFSLGLFHGFIWLDKLYVLYNTDLVPFDLSKLFTLKGFTGGGYYRPITAVYYSILLNLFQDNVFPFKLVQFLIHLTNVYLVFILFQKFMKKNLAFFLTLVFLVHPMNVVSVTYVSAAAGPLFFLFGISALLISLNDRIHGVVRFLALFSLTLLSFLSKEEGLIFGLLILLFSFLFKRSKLIMTFIPVLFSAAIYFYLRLFIGRVSFVQYDIVPIMRLSFVERLYNIPAVVTYYLKTFFLPIKLATNQQWTVTSLSLSNFYLPLIALVTIGLSVGFVFFWMKREGKENLSHFFFFLMWFALALGIYFHLVPLDYTVTNRWFYLPMVGLIGMVGVILNKIRIDWHNKYVGIFMVLLVVVLATRSFFRLTNWKDEVTLFGHDSEIITNFSTEENLAIALYEKGKYQESLVHLKNSVKMFAYDGNLLHLAQLYEQLKDIENAKKYYLLAAETENYAPGSHDKFTYKLIARFFIKYDAAVARKIIRKGIEEHPDSYRLWALQAINEYYQGNRKEAFLAANKALSKNSNHLTAHLLVDIVSNAHIEIDDSYIF